ncbi:hypothetical protein ACHAWF_013144 [Thalassiosira exigua]
MLSHSRARQAGEDEDPLAPRGAGEILDPGRSWISHSPLQSEFDIVKKYLFPCRILAGSAGVIQRVRVILFVFSTRTDAARAAVAAAAAAV